MTGTEQELMTYIEEEDVKFIRLAFCDVYGVQKNISIQRSELSRAFEKGIAVDTSDIFGIGGGNGKEIRLHPEPDTITVLPWRPEHGKVVRMFCTLTYSDGSPVETDTRALLHKAVRYAQSKGYRFNFKSELQFYLFKMDDNGENTKIPYDNAGYMDIAPLDKGENVRREICLTLEQMGIKPESSHHEAGPGQNEIDFRYADPITAADNRGRCHGFRDCGNPVQYSRNDGISQSDCRFFSALRKAQGAAIHRLVGKEPRTADFRPHQRKRNPMRAIAVSRPGGKSVSCLRADDLCGIRRH